MTVPVPGPTSEPPNVPDLSAVAATQIVVNQVATAIPGHEAAARRTAQPVPVGRGRHPGIAPAGIARDRTAHLLAVIRGQVVAEGTIVIVRRRGPAVTRPSVRGCGQRI
jgi:hypothetical protein